MLTAEQEKWIAHLSNTDKIIIVPFDPTVEEKYQKVKQTVQEALGKNISVFHRGASNLGISGQDEIDIYLPVPPSEFDLFIEPIKKIFGDPRSLYPLERVHFVTEVEGKHIDVFLINNECEGWINGLKFEEYLKSHPETLEEYRKLKEGGNGLSGQKYYRRKIEFINGILEKLANINAI